MLSKKQVKLVPLSRSKLVGLEPQYKWLGILPDVSDGSKAHSLKDIHRVFYTEACVDSHMH